MNIKVVLIQKENKENSTEEKRKDLSMPKRSKRYETFLGVKSQKRILLLSVHSNTLEELSKRAEKSIGNFMKSHGIRELSIINRNATMRKASSFCCSQETMSNARRSERTYSPAYS